LTAEVQKRAEQLADVNQNLEKTVEHRTSELRARNEEHRLILDNVSEGMFTVDMAGVMQGARSAVIDRWFGAPAPGTKFSNLISSSDREVGVRFQIGIEEVGADELPLELTLDQMPHTLVLGTKHLRFSYHPLLEGGKPSQLLVILEDITSEIEANRGAALHAELVRIFHACKRDQAGFLDFFVDAREMVGALCSNTARPLVEVKRTLHTLKGNCAIYGVLGVSALCHDIETNMEETGAMAATDVVRLAKAWDDVATTVNQIIGDDANSGMVVGEGEYAAIIDSIVSGTPRQEVLAAIVKWRLEPTERRLGRFAEQARGIASRLGKSVEVRSESNGVRVCPKTWSPVWSSLIHVISNAIDHGIESTEERIGSGKPATARLTLRTSEHAGAVTVEISDDGRGIAWDRIAAKARASNLPAATPEDLVEALFADGFTTKDIATSVSGRGVGMGAFRNACRELGGDVAVESDASTGTTIRCSFPSGANVGAGVAELLKRRCAPTALPPMRRAG
jgi:two-component system chemotaxis sensor kinase CheA